MAVATKKQREILDWFSKNITNPESELNFNTPFELLVAVILSAQCTDKRVNLVTPSLLKRYPTALAMSKASYEQVYEYIKSISYPNSKARRLVDMAKMLVKDFGGEVPSNIEELILLPGVGRKTANVVASIYFNKPVIAVDTHVFRVAHRIEFSKGKTPLEVEKDLERIIPKKDRARGHHWLILHGRYTCKAINPQCSLCGLNPLCPKLLEGSKLSR